MHLQSTAASILDIESKLAVALLLWPKYELGELTTLGLGGLLEPSGAGTTDIAGAKKVSRDGDGWVQVRRREACSCMACSTKAASYNQCDNAPPRSGTSSPT